MLRATMSHPVVMGAGAWGTALAKVLADRGERVSLYTWQEAHAQAMRRDRENKEFFRGFPLPEGVEPTSELRALSDSDLIVLVIPSHAFRETLEKARTFIPPSAALVTATKGIETDSLMLMSEV